jgi:hypothetical protein
MNTIQLIIWTNVMKTGFYLMDLFIEDFGNMDILKDG